MTDGLATAVRVARFERRAMGSPLRLQVHLAPERDDAWAEAGWRRVSDDVEATEAALSRFRATSELTALNHHAGTPAPVSRRLYAALAAADRAWRLTGGRFDPRILGDLERLGSIGVPQGDAAAALTSRGSAAPWLRRDPRAGRVALAVPIDLGGIGKGLALRWAWRALALPVGAGALIDAGGDLVLGGPTADGGPWRVAVEDPGGGTPLAVIAVRGGAVCTSSTRLGRWRSPDGRTVHHLLDPRTGEPGGRGLLAVTVAGADPAWAEVWSKTLFLAGAAGVGDAARARGLAAWWVELDGTLHLTPAARPLTVWTAS